MANHVRSRYYVVSRQALNFELSPPFLKPHHQTSPEFQSPLNVISYKHSLTQLITTRDTICLTSHHRQGIRVRRMPSTSKPCHNCRRRRLRCDRSWPSCHKCAVSGQECLGYGKVFVWTQAIDANGNLKPSPSRRAAVPVATPPTVHAPPPVQQESVLSTAGLTDPLFQDLDKNSRYYLAHCKFVSHLLIHPPMRGHSSVQPCTPLAWIKTLRTFTHRQKTLHTLHIEIHLHILPRAPPLPPDQKH